MRDPDKERYCFCHDGSVIPMIGRRESDGKWYLYICDIIGMGSAEYKKKAIPGSFDDLVPMNSFSGKSYVCLQRKGKWGLIELRNSQSEYFEWSKLETFRHQSKEAMLESRSIDAEKYAMHW